MQYGGECDLQLPELARKASVVLAIFHKNSEDTPHGVVVGGGGLIYITIILFYFH
jgi:hypothetical protein